MSLVGFRAQNHAQQSDIFMPRPLYLHLRDLCSGARSDAFELCPNSCRECAAIIAWARGEGDPLGPLAQTAERPLEGAVS